MSFVILNAVVDGPVAPGGTFTVPYAGAAQEQFTDPQTVYLDVYLRRFSDLQVSFGASEATVTWPAGAPYPLPKGSYNLDFDLVGPDTRGVMEFQADSTAIDVAGLVADFNALLAKARAAGLMETA